MTDQLNKAQMADDFGSIPDPGFELALARIRRADQFNDAVALLREGERTMGNEERVQWKKRVGAYLSGLTVPSQNGKTP